MVIHVATSLSQGKYYSSHCTSYMYKVLYIHVLAYMYMYVRSNHWLASCYQDMHIHLYMYIHVRLLNSLNDGKHCQPTSMPSH